MLWVEIDISASDDSEKGAWNDAALLYPKIIRLLAIPAYRKSLLLGLLMSISSKTGSTVRWTAPSFYFTL